MKSLKDLEVRGKKVLMRVDFNVPLDEQGTITDDTRILAILPTLEYLISHGAITILCSHCGRPKGVRLAKYSLAPVANRLGEILKIDVPLAPDCIGPDVQSLVKSRQPGDVLLLENLRFYAQETTNDPEFSQQLASLADIYINDAFAVSHRAHASVEGVVHFVEQCAPGFLLQKETDFFNRAISNPIRPLAVVLGGAKVSSKLEAIRNMLNLVDIMVIGGAMANTFLKSLGLETGRSLVENDLLETARELVDLAKKKGVKLYLPVDCVIADKFDQLAISQISTTLNVPLEWTILDIGPATSTLFRAALAPAKTIIWNGPMGAFEISQFSRGSLAMVDTVTSSHAMTIVGGGDTNALIHIAGAANDVSYMSTGGGAFLMLMEGKKLPGITALEK